MAQEYVLGFLMTGDLDNPIIHFIEKKRPKWQEGLFNGIGGHIEEDETPEAAMTREFYEEAGIQINTWNKFAVMKGKEFVVHCFYIWVDSDVFNQVRAITDERIFKFQQSEVIDNPQNFIENIPWLLHMVKSRRIDKVEHYVIDYIR